MPITTSRLITLLNAGLDYRHAYDSLKSYASHLIHQYEHGHTTAEQTLSDLKITISQDHLIQGQQSDYALWYENDRYSNNMERNRLERDRMRRARGGLIGDPHPEPPRLLFPPQNPRPPAEEDLRQQIAELALKVYELEHGKAIPPQSKPQSEPEPDPLHDPDDADEELGDSISRGDF